MSTFLLSYFTTFTTSNKEFLSTFSADSLSLQKYFVILPAKDKRMPKILLYITAKIIWQFLFWNTDFNENRAHVHVGKRGTQRLCKIWLEPVVELAQQGDLTDAQAKQVLAIAAEYREKLLSQWSLFKQGKRIRIITVKKTKK